MKKIIIFISALFLSITLYYFFRQFYIYENYRSYYTFYTYFYFIVFVISLFIFFSQELIQKYYLISFISIFVSLYLYEFSIYKINKHSLLEKKILEWETPLKNYIGEEQNIYLHKKKLKDESGFSAFSLNTSELISLSGISNKKIVFCNENGYFSTYNSDRFGFNNPDYIWDKKIDAVMLGDSFAHGACVDAGYDISSQLRKISKLNIANLGWSNSGPLKQYGTFVEYINKPPEYIIWLYYENDLIDLQKELENQLLIKYFNSEFKQNLTDNNKRNKIDNEILKIHYDYLNYDFVERKKITKNSKFKNFLTLYETRQFIFNNFNNRLLSNQKNLKKFEKLIDAYLEIIRKLNQKVIENNTKILIVYIPMKNNFFNENSLNNILKEKIKKKVIEEDLIFVDLEEEIREIDIPIDTIYPDGDFYEQHFNERGYKIISDIIKNKIKL